MAGAIIFGEIWIDSRARNVVIFNTKCVAEGVKVSSPNGRVKFLQFHARIILGSWSDRPRIVIDASTVFSRFSSYFGMSLCVAGAIFGEVGGSIMRVILRGRRNIWRGWRVSAVTPRINPEIHVPWQVQYVVKLEGDACCFAHCK